MNAIKDVGELGDKNEEFLEKMHQEMKKMLFLTCRMTCGWESRVEYINRILWRDSDPMVRHQTSLVEKNLARNFSTERKSKSGKMSDKLEERWERYLEVEQKYKS